MREKIDAVPHRVIRVPIDISQVDKEIEATLAAGAVCAPTVTNSISSPSQVIIENPCQSRMLVQVYSASTSLVRYLHLLAFEKRSIYKYGGERATNYGDWSSLYGQPAEADTLLESYDKSGGWLSIVRNNTSSYNAVVLTILKSGTPLYEVWVSIEPRGERRVYWTPDGSSESVRLDWARLDPN